MTSNSETYYTACKVCQSPKLASLYVSSQEKLPIVSCRSCGLFFVGRNFNSGEQHAIYDEEADYLAYVDAARSVPQRSARYRRLLNQIRQYSAERFDGRKMKILDIGCGAGDFLAVAKSAGFEAYGIEISPPAVQLAATTHNLDVKLCGVEAYDPPFRFEAITLINVLEHVSDPKAMLVHADRLLAPGGILYIYTPVWGWYDRIASFLARISKSRFTRLIDRRINEAHLQIFPRTTLLRIMQDIGLRVATHERVCEYNLPIHEYLRSIGIGRTMGGFLTSLIEALANRKCFFRNNIRVFAAKEFHA